MIFYPLATDNFDRADNLDLGANWTPTTGRSLQIVSNHVEPTLLATGDDESFTGRSWAVDHYSRANLTATGTMDLSGVGISVRSQAPIRTYYDCVANKAASNNISIGKEDSDNFTLLAQVTETWSDGDEFTLAVSGAGILAYHGSTLIATATDSALTTGEPGIRYSAVLTAGTIDNWEGGNFFLFDNISTNYKWPMIAGV